MTDPRIHQIVGRVRAEMDALERVAAEALPPPSRPPIIIPEGKGLQKPAAFFDVLRSSDVIFGGKLTASQVSGCERLCAMGAGRLPLSWMAYVLGSAYHEGGHTMQPIRERGSGDGPDADTWDDYLQQYDTGEKARRLGNTPEADGDGVRMCGRGDIMITGTGNYTFATIRLRELGILTAQEDLIATPDLALRGDVSAAIAVFGCLEGWFTGRKLRDFLQNPATLEQLTNARRVVNGTDRAALIASYAWEFQNGLKAGEWL